MWHTDNEGQDAFENENPLPTREASGASHFQDTTSEKTAESTGRRGRRKEDSHAETALVPLVPHADAVGAY
jgi:hypothetical protein